MSNLLGKKKIFEHSYQYACRITSRLIKIAHFLEIFEVRGNAPSGHPLSLIDATESGVFGGFKRPVKFLVGSVLISLRIKTRIAGGQKQLLLTQAVIFAR
jgi:hypothetical protein